MAEKKPAQLMSIKDGNEEKLHIRTTSSVVSLDRTNPKLPENIYDIQALANALGKLAFLDDTVDPPEPEPEPPLPCKNLTAVATRSAIQLTWEDPDDDTWASTRIVRKTGGYPTSETDGTIVTTTYVKNQYQSSSFLDDGLSSGVTYYYRAFSCSSKGIFNTEDQVTASATIKTSTYKIMTVKIDLYDSNPQTCGSFADDALAMPYGKESAAIEKWHEFFGYKPCLFKNGAVVGYLNPNNYSEYEDGSYADITSGNSGDVMVEFPRRGIKMYNTSNHLVISMTDDPDDPDFTYYAHTRGSERKDAFYLGAYLASYNAAGFHSLSGGDIVHGFTFENIKTSAKVQYMTFYMWTYIQVMYCLQFRGDLRSDDILPSGYVDLYATYTTGVTNRYGLIYGDSKPDDDTRNKLFGLEDPHSFYDQYLDGILHDATSNTIYIATDNFSPDGKTVTESYVRYDDILPANEFDGILTRVVGTSECGFLPKKVSGSSSSTYFCDYVNFDQDETAIAVGRSSTYATYGGLFSIGTIDNKTVSQFRSFRISYL